MNQNIRIVVDGADRLRAAGNYTATRKRILAEVTQRYKIQSEPAGFWHRLWIAAGIRREVREELKKLFPPSALHVAVR